MKGVITHINEPKGRVAVVTDEGDFSVFELAGCAPAALNDIVCWEGEAPIGAAPVVNETRRERFEVLFHHHHVDCTQLRRQLRYP
jgi:hypothetical protein